MESGFGVSVWFCQFGGLDQKTISLGLAAVFVSSCCNMRSVFTADMPQIAACTARACTWRSRSSSAENLCCAIAEPHSSAASRTRRAFMLLHLFEIAGLPALVERRGFRSIDADVSEPSFAGLRLDPAPFLACRRLGADIQIGGRRLRHVL